jgi:hypothetical protein
MGVINQMWQFLFGGGRNVVVETAEVFRVNAEAQAARDMTMKSASLDQYASEFALMRQGRFDRFMDALNRVPRPAMALGTLGLFVSAMVDPVWFAARMTGIALVPEPLWWLLGAIVSFYFGARYQAKGQQFQRDIAATMVATPQVVQHISDIENLRREPVPEVASISANPALEDWKRLQS